MKKHLSRLLSALLALTLLIAPASALTVDQALELLEDTYYYGVPEQAYEAQTLDELFRILGDPYTDYMDQEEYAAFLDLVEDTVDMVGIGVEIIYTQEGMFIEKVLSGGSALEGGLQAGDLIVAIDGAPCVPALEEHRRLIQGAEGTTVTVTILRDGETRDYILTRSQIYIPNTEITLLEGGVGYVDCNSFGTDTGELFAGGLKQYDSQVDCWVLDLRDNAGGYVESAVDMLAALEGPGRYLYFEDSDGLVTGFVSDDTALTQKPLILLVNSESASASELVASGVRDMDRGITVGSRTFGKGIGQSVLDGDSDPEYFDGDCLKVTTGRFYSIGGNSNHMMGVIPTLLVDDGDAEAVAAALAQGSETGSSLCVVPGGTPFYVAPDADDDVVSALLEAIPPQVSVFYSGGGTFYPYTPAEAAERLGLDIDSRWFTDVEDSTYANAIDAMGVYRLLNGTAPGVFSPKGQLTRAQLCVMLARVLNVSWDGPSGFSDVAQEAWYGPSVNAIAELGLVDGVGGGKFDPESPVTQQQLLTILGRTARYLNIGLESYGQEVEAAQAEGALPLDMQASLAPYAEWAWDSVAVLAWGLEDVLGGYDDMLYAPLGSIDPAAPVLREEAAAGMYAVLAGLEILP